MMILQKNKRRKFPYVQRKRRKVSIGISFLIKCMTLKNLSNHFVFSKTLIRMRNLFFVIRRKIKSESRTRMNSEDEIHPIYCRYFGTPLPECGAEKSEERNPEPIAKPPQIEPLNEKNKDSPPECRHEMARRRISRPFEESIEELPPIQPSYTQMATIIRDKSFEYFHFNVGCTKRRWKSDERNLFVKPSEPRMKNNRLKLWGNVRKFASASNASNSFELSTVIGNGRPHDVWSCSCDACREGLNKIRMAFIQKFCVC